mmetsp:Transcript_2745/g.3115  ORF Transcript_2745/g.3115 Transcript_2745/m.3115 type:complete len:103 (+) Transcript_2745:970-1278(+)
MIRNNKQERNTGKSNLISGSCLSSHSTPSIEEGLDRSVKCLRTIFNSFSQIEETNMGTGIDNTRKKNLPCCLLVYTLSSVYKCIRKLLQLLQQLTHRTYHIC